ncbi:phage virion morphogenesis protein [Dysgonomonas sp. 520]|uniref:phage virion morphogenesis protein n=1 Tax=Dysgonomonas sp. 520 TaxID=2302931 RepID=UPI0013D14718|nr:phage virion morphogenesis protein [Dysgonomonas sp. 520]NDW10466.1 virion morphogenesis protein [Dysgonomonas sp. 520]
MTDEQFIKLLQQNAAEIRDFIDNTFPYLAGDIAVNHFKENFEKEGFVDNGLHPWDDVVRRDSASPWYGFEPTNKNRYSPTRATDPILKNTNELADATDYEVRSPGEVVIVNDKPYAQIHNEGGQAYIFGKTPFTMKKRQFIGDSAELDEKEINMLTDELDKIIKP